MSKPRYRDAHEALPWPWVALYTAAAAAVVAHLLLPPGWALALLSGALLGGTP